MLVTASMGPAWKNPRKFQKNFRKIKPPLPLAKGGIFLTRNSSFEKPGKISEIRVEDGIDVSIKPYDEEIARDVIEQVRNGKTLTSICQGRRMSRLDVYDWLRDKEARIGKRRFRDVYAEAEDDRRMTWRDMAILEVTTATAENISLARQKAQMLMSAAKEGGIEIVTRSGGPEAPTVVIRKFYRPLQDEGEGSGEAE